MAVTVSEQESLDYHKKPAPGKIGAYTTVPFASQKDLALAYTPGVAYPCLEIQKNPSKAYEYTNKSNTVAVISNGTAVLGLGDIGALASKPVMEGKSVLFNQFSKLNSFDIEVDEKDIDKFCQIVKAISVGFGGINLEDIKAPECFEIESRLIRELDIAVMHDDQHGTAIITSAAMLNACKLTNKKVKDIKVVIVGAGASALSSAKMYKEFGVENIVIIDSKGVVHKNREDLNPYKEKFAIDKEMSKNDAFRGADMVLGLSAPGTFDKTHIALMNHEPIVFSLANPTPEIFPDEVRSIRDKAVIATGRSDFANQVNNVLGFPFIFRGALDVNAKTINMQMKKAAALALADLATQEVHQDVCDIYGKKLFFSKEYIIPTPFDKRLLPVVSTAVAQAAVDSKAARIKHFDKEKYFQSLQKMANPIL
jgi:malate dehydrogenase (oxaloacetate-decarboxylating)/malate dehydrogenase (oxaloacetate-decarboxylating)(NADP+)